MDANRIDDPRELKAGELLYVPGARDRKPVPEYDAPEPEAAPRADRTATAAAPEKKPAKVVRVGKGTGLGLPFVREVAELHDGDVRLDSRTAEEEGGPGTTATLVLPLAE